MPHAVPPPRHADPTAKPPSAACELALIAAVLDGREASEGMIEMLLDRVESRGVVR